MPLSATLHRLKDQYLDRVKQGGGTKEGFQEFARNYFHGHPDEYNPDAALRHACDKIWAKKKKEPAPDLFTIAQVQLPETLTYPDSAREGHFRQISQKYATVLHLREDAILTIRSGATITTAGEAKMKVADEALRRAKGDFSALLSTIKD
jgi:hypothetical protein